MAEINSPIGRRSFPSSQQKTFVVDDPTAQAPIQPTLQSRLAEKKLFEEQQKKEEAKKISQEMTSLEVILGVGRATKEIQIESDTATVVYTIQTRKVTDAKIITNLTLKLRRMIENKQVEDVADHAYSINIYTLVFSVVAINGRTIDSYLDIPEECTYEEIIDIKYEFFEQFDDAIVGRLVNEINQLVAQNSARYMFKSPEEVAEAITKSV